MTSVKFVVNPPSPTFERNKELFPRLRQAYVSDDEEEAVSRIKLRRYHSAQSLRTEYAEHPRSMDQPSAARRRTSSHHHRSAPSTPPRMTKAKQYNVFTAPSSPSSQRHEPPRTRLSSEPLRKMRSLDGDFRTYLSRRSSGSSSDSSSRRSVSSSASLSSAATSVHEMEVSPVRKNDHKRELRVPLPDTTKALARATDAFQYGLIAFGAAVALWTLFAVLFASYGLTALDSITSGTKWLEKYSPLRRKARSVDESSTPAMPRPPVKSLIPTLLFTLLVWGGDQAANSMRVGRKKAPPA